MKQRKVRASGFTLIELLVVIAIIAILAAILFPVFAKARERAKVTNCISNEKQIGAAIMQYTADYDEQYPKFAYNGVPGGTINPANDCPSYGYDYAIRPFVKSWNVYLCPSQPHFQDWNTRQMVTPNPNPPSGTKGRSSYGFNYRMVDYPPHPATAANPNPPVYLNDFKDPAGTIFLAENEDGQHITNEAYMWNGRSNGIPSGIYPNLANEKDAMAMYKSRERHFGRVSFIFADGHVANLFYAQTKSPKNMWTLDPAD